MEAERVERDTHAYGYPSCYSYTGGYSNPNADSHTNSAAAFAWAVQEICRLGRAKGIEVIVALLNRRSAQ